MGEGSTQSQHLVQTEVPTKVLEGWLARWAEFNQIPGPLKVSLRPHTPGSDVLELASIGPSGDKVANMIFTTVQDRRHRLILSVRDQNTYDTSMRRKRLVTLLHLFLVHRYKAAAIHYLSPTEDNARQSESMKALGIFSATHEEVGEIIVADINMDVIKTAGRWRQRRAGEADHPRVT